MAVWRRETVVCGGFLLFCGFSLSCFQLSAPFKALAIQVGLEGCSTAVAGEAGCSPVALTGFCHWVKLCVVFLCKRVWVHCYVLFALVCSLLLLWRCGKVSFKLRVQLNWDAICTTWSVLWLVTCHGIKWLHSFQVLLHQESYYKWKLWNQSHKTSR